MTKNIFDWNHISSNLTQDHITKHIIGNVGLSNKQQNVLKNVNYWVIHYQSCLQLVVSRQQ